MVRDCNVPGVGIEIISVILPDDRDERRRASASSRAGGSIASLGSASVPSIGPTFHTFWCWLNVWQTRFAFVLADRCGDSVDVEAVGPADSLAELVQIFDN